MGRNFLALYYLIFFCCLNLKIGDVNLENSICEKLLGIEVNDKVSFNEYLNGIIKKVSRKVSALPRISSFVDLMKRHPF